MSFKDNTDRACESLLTEEEDDDFKDCIEDIDAVLPENVISYSPKSQNAFQAELNKLVRQIQAQLDDFEATHEIKSTPTYLTGSKDIFEENTSEGSSKCGNNVQEPAEFMTVDQANGQLITAPSLKIIEIQKIGKTFECCIQEVNSLEKKRDELVQELLELKKPMEEEVQVLRSKLSEAQKLLIQSKFQKENLHVEMLLLRRRLFAAARDCAQSQMVLDIQQKEVDQLNHEQEKMKAHILELTEVIIKLRSEHQDKLQVLKHQKERISQEPTEDTSSSYLSHSRQASQDLQQYLQGEIKALEAWYEPRLVALLKRQQSSTEALSKYKEQCQELKAKLEPLRDEEQKLVLKRARLEEHICLMERQRKENIEQYRKIINLLEENRRELKTELQFQTKKVKETEELKNTLLQQLHLYKENIEEEHAQDFTLMEKKT